MFGFTRSIPQHWSGVSSQLHSLAIVPLKQHSGPIECGAGWAPAPVWTLWKKTNLLPLLGTESWIGQPMVQLLDITYGKDGKCVHNEWKRLLGKSSDWWNIWAVVL